MRMALSIPVVLQIDQHSALAGVFGGMMLRVPHFPVGHLVVLAPRLFGYGPALQKIAGAEAERSSQFPVFRRDPRQELEEKRRIAFLIFVPRVAPEFGLA